MNASRHSGNRHAHVGGSKCTCGTVPPPHHPSRFVGSGALNQRVERTQRGTLRTSQTLECHAEQIALFGYTKESKRTDTRPSKRQRERATRNETQQSTSAGSHTHQLESLLRRGALKRHLPYRSIVVPPLRSSLAARSTHDPFSTPCRAVILCVCACVCLPRLYGTGIPEKSFAAMYGASDL